MANRPVHRVGTCFKRIQDGEVFVITHIDSCSNHKGAWFLYTFAHLNGADRYCLRVRDIKKRFVFDKVAQTLYGDKYKGAQDV